MLPRFARADVTTPAGLEEQVSVVCMPGVCRLSRSGQEIAVLEGVILAEMVGGDRHNWRVVNDAGIEWLIRRRRGG